MATWLLVAAALTVSVPSLRAQTAHTDMARALEAADRAEIVELSAHFDNSLDAEDAGKFVATFTNDGELVGFWGTSKGPEGLRKAHAFMLATFAKDKRHVVTNHEISVMGDHATMFCYLTVFDRRALAVTGTATFTDELVKRDGHWKFARRTLAADPNVDPIIKGLQGQK
jgi:ketosteroid isomerase-like protein